jgi:type I restriction enzyme S subunit
VKTVALGELVVPAKVKRAGSTEYPVLSMTMHDGLVVQTARFKKRIASLDTSDYKVVRHGQLVVGFPINEGVLDFQLRHDAAVVSPAYGIWDLRDESLVDRNYLKRFLKSPRAIEYYVGKMKGSTARRRSLPTAEFNAMPIPLPELPEQHRIAEILDLADTLRTKRRSMPSLLLELSESLYERHTAGASEVTVAELLGSGALKVHKDGNHGSLYPRAQEFAADGVPFLTAKAVRDDGTLVAEAVDHLNEEKARQLRIGWIEDGDVLLSHNASVGKVAVYEGQFGRALIGTSLTAFRPDRTRLNPRFLAASLRSAFFQLQLTRNMAQTTRNQVPITAQRNLKLKWVDLEQQRAFVHIEDLVNLRLENLWRAVEAHDHLFVSLQSRAFRGDL